MALSPRLSTLSVEFFRIDLAIAVAPSTPMQLSYKLNEVNVELFSCAKVIKAGKMGTLCIEEASVCGEDLEIL